MPDITTTREQREEVARAVGLTHGLGAWVESGEIPNTANASMMRGLVHLALALAQRDARIAELERVNEAAMAVVAAEPCECACLCEVDKHHADCVLCCACRVGRALELPLHQCSGCALFIRAIWDHARASGWVSLTQADGNAEVLCPDCLRSCNDQ